MTSFIIGCVADDFTGGSDAASFLKKAGLRTVLSDGIPSSFDQITDYDAIVIALKSRTQETHRAVQDSLDALQWLRDHGAQKLYLKYCSTFDSTPTGNIGPVADAAMERFSVPYTILAPALLPNGRTVRDGTLFVNGTPLAESHMCHHPLTPMWDSRIAELMRRQSAYPCFPIPESFYSDSAALFSQISLWQQQYSHFYLVPDDWKPDHGHKIAALFGSLPFLTGGSGLLEDLGALASISTSGPLTPPMQDRSPRLMLAGSCSSATQEQVHRWLESGGAGIQLDPDTIRRIGPTPFLEKAIQAQEDLLFYSSGSIGVLAGRSPSPEDAALLEQSMAAIAAHMHRSGKLHRLVVAGGETSGAVMQALHLRTFSIGESIAPGVPEMSPVDTPSLRVILKSGNFGGPDFFLNALKEET